MRWILPGLVLLVCVAAVGCDTGTPPPPPTITVLVTKAALPPTDTPVPARPTDTAAPAPTSVPTPSPVPINTPVPLFVGKTDGDGIWLRASPPLGDKLKSWPDGTRMVVVGADQTVDGKIWKKVKDPKGTVGWVAADYLVSEAQLTPASGAATPTKSPSG